MFGKLAKKTRPESSNRRGHFVVCQWMSRAESMKKEGLKSTNKPDLVIKGKTAIQDSTFFNDAVRVWNMAPVEIKNCRTLHTMKKQIKTFIRTLPI